MDGDGSSTYFAWQERTPDGRWGMIAALVPAIGLEGVLISWEERLVRGVFGSVAELHGERTGHPVRLVRLEIVEVLDGR